MHITSTLLLVFPALIAAQYATDCGVGQVTFNQCVSNSITDGLGQPARPGTVVEAACANVQNNQQQYYCCLCKGFQGIAGCLSSFCTTSNSITSIGQSVSQYCSACQPANTLTATRPSGSSLAFPTLAGTAAAPTPTPTFNTPAPTNTVSAQNNAENIKVGVGAAVAAAGVAALFV
ncbi:hypothetical protein DFS34DRAFT_654631 [Phlyctochytrium arcticum]|nr:hypothetical protein DFS34DRAFT_654631 [Phlyctochytrium arcticum]